MTKKFKLLLIALFLVFTGVVLFSDRQKAPTLPKKEATQKQSTFIIDYGDGKKESATFTPRPDQTVFAALKVVAQEKNIPLETQQYDFGIFVKSIGSYKSSAEMAWIYFINGSPGTIAADKQQINAGDLIEWRYVKPE